MTIASIVFLLVTYLQIMSTAWIIILSVLGVAFFVLEGYVCGRVATELVHKKDNEINEVMWFWVGFMFSWAGILLTLVVKEKKN
jgi:hypothetical protein